MINPRFAELVTGSPKHAKQDPHLPDWLLLDEGTMSDEEFLKDFGQTLRVETALAKAHAAFPESRLRVRMSRDPDSGLKALSIRAMVSQNTKETRELAADLAISMYEPDVQNGIALVFGVETI
ncbi:hypothetical protein EON79_06265 [bacterium]|nr:MAG: hypothetical protein EON79_06265 [bacterium]